MRRYKDYHLQVISETKKVLSQRDIEFELMDLDVLLMRPRLAVERSVGKLLVIWSEDFLHSAVTTDHESISAVEILGSLKDTGPVLWLTAVDCADLDFGTMPDNVRFLHYGSDMLFQMLEYPKIAPQREKNPESTQWWISLNHAPRPARIITACCLMGMGLGHRASSGLLKISDFPITNYDQWLGYLSDQFRGDITYSPDQSQVLQQGFQAFKAMSHGGQDCGNIYRGLEALDNAGNFDRNLRRLYQNSLVEIVNETTFFSRGIFVTEKFLNSVYGYNLPIVMSTAGTVGYLRDHGFDMFDDVIDHGYDLVADPIQRIFTAVESNLRLLTDRDHAQQCWQLCQSRLDQNFILARDQMYDHFLQKFREDLSRLLDKDLGLSYNMFLTKEPKWAE